MALHLVRQRVDTAVLVGETKALLFGHAAPHRFFRLQIGSLQLSQRAFLLVNGPGPAIVGPSEV
jgi:hypothetical protein